MEAPLRFELRREVLQTSALPLGYSAKLIFNVAKLAIFQYIESWYNRRRIHSSIGYISPQKCEDIARMIS